MRGGKREGSGRPTGSTGKELKKPFTIRAYPSDVDSLKKKDKTLQKAVDSGVDLLLGKRNTWTTEKPAKAGQYWVKREGSRGPMWTQDVTTLDTPADGYEWCEIERPPR